MSPPPPYMPEFADAYPLDQAGELLNNLNSEKIKADFAHNLRNWNPTFLIYIY